MVETVETHVGKGKKGKKEKKVKVVEKRRSFTRGMRKLKHEAVVMHRSFDSKFFVSITGPLNTYFKPTAANTEWDMMRRFAQNPKDWWRLAKIFTEDLLSVIIIPMGFLLMARSRVRFKNKTEGDHYAKNNEQNDEDWWYINGIGVNGGE